MLKNPDDDAIRAIFTSTRVIAVVGASANPMRPSHYVGQFLRSLGYRVIGVNPGLVGQTLYGEPVYAALTDIPADVQVDMIDIFRNSDAVPEVVDQALAMQGHPLRTVWMQIGVVNEPAAARARSAGMTVVQNKCPKIEIPHLFDHSPLQNA